MLNSRCLIKCINENLFDFCIVNDEISYKIGLLMLIITSLSAMW